MADPNPSPFDKRDLQGELAESTRGEHAASAPNPSTGESLGAAGEPPNPYSAPIVTDVLEASDGAVALEPSVPESPASGASRSLRERIWTPLLAIPVAWSVFMTVSVGMLGIAVFSVVPGASVDSFRSQETLQSVSSSRLGLFLLMVPPQVAMASIALIAAVLSPVAFRDRLGLVRGHWPWWAWLGGAVATPLVGIFSGLLVSQFTEESAQLKEMSRIFTEHAAGGFLLPLGLMVGLTPAICEEVLFRGYVQTRLTRSLHPLIGIAIASFFFAAFHMDLVHVISVFPLGVYMGYLCWRSRSLYPAILAHFVNNFISVMMVSIAPEDNLSEVSGGAVFIILGVMGCGFLGLVGVVAASILYNSDDEAEVEGNL